MKKINITDLLTYIIAAELVGAASAFFSGGFSDFFIKYNEPPLLPPVWLFPVVWVILYGVMGFSAYLISSSEADKTQIKSALNIYRLQLALNFSWSIVFFRFEMLKAAFAIIIALLFLIGVMIYRFYKINRLAAIINIPYLIWVAFASYLNLATIIVNM